MTATTVTKRKKLRDENTVLYNRAENVAKETRIWKQAIRERKEENGEKIWEEKKKHNRIEKVRWSFLRVEIA